MKRLVFFIVVSFFLPVQAACFGYDRGIFAARNGDTERAVSLLTEELTASPDNPALLYDNGILAYKQQKYAQAEAFFSKTVGYTSSENQLHRQALFNLGNAYVGEKKLHEALTTYTQLLALDPSHEKARHNRDVVKKMLEQQTQESPAQGSSTQDDKKNNKDQKNKQQSGNGQQQDQQQDRQGDARDRCDQGQQKKRGDKNSENHDAQKNKQAGVDDAQQPEKKVSDQQSSEASGDQDNQKRDGKDGNQLDERDSYKERYGKRNHDADGKDEQGASTDPSQQMKHKTDDQEGNDEQRACKHDGSPSQKPSSAGAPLGGHTDNASTTKPMKVAGKAQESARKEQKKQYAAWAEAMLDAVQLNDEALNKVLVQRAVAGSLGGRDGECCW